MITVWSSGETLSSGHTELMSGGCVNVSMPDAEWLFDWTDPRVPDGWQGVVGLAAELGKSTAVVVRR